MQSIQSKSTPGMGKAAFTLVEMLVVIAIISILMTAGSIGLSGMGGKGVTSGVATAESLFDEARSMAVGKNLRSCVLVAKSLTNNSADDLKRIVVAYEPLDDTGQPTTPAGVDPAWVVSGRGAVLPDQTFFSDDFSKKDHDAGSESIESITLTGAKKSYEGEYYIYEFNSQGICATPGASFVIGNGSRNLTQPASAQPPKVMASSKRDFGGFVVWRNGRTSVFRNPDQISTSLPAPGGKF
jgi:prepilin-type N-terminal cleavage/methylation domain-containing protein